MKASTKIIAAALGACTLIGSVALWRTHAAYQQKKNAQAKERVFGILESLNQDLSLLPRNARAQEAPSDSAAATACNDSASAARELCKATKRITSMAPSGISTTRSAF